MKASQIIATIKECYRDNIPLMIHGPAGCGKSSVIKQAVSQLAVELSMPDFGFIDFRAALKDAVDVGGMPYIENGITRYAVPAQMPSSGCGILDVEEINLANQQTLGALYQLILDRAINDYVMPRGWLPVATGNRKQDKGFTQTMPDPLVDRFEHVEMEVDMGEWVQWALVNNIHPFLIAFYRFRPECLHQHNTQRDCYAFATPRGAEDVSKILYRQSVNEADRIRGRIGDSVAGELLPYLKLCRERVTPDQVLLNPLSANVPTNSSILYALALALARRATDKNIDAVMAYSGRMPAEYQHALVSAAVSATPALATTREYIVWQSKQDQASAA